MSTSKLEIYNAALVICGERILASLTEDRKPRRLLDQVWDNDGVEACLERAQWKFAMNSIKLDYDTSVTTDFGYRRTFAKPSDWVLTSAVCSDEFFTTPLIRYTDENDFWYAELDMIYVKYVSNSTDFGLNLSLWPPTFNKFVSAYFANEIVLGLTQDQEIADRVEKRLDKTMKLAKSNDSMAGPQQFPAPGAFVNSRYRGRTTRDRGSRSNLIG
jgi:hypothetical protein